MYGDRNSDKTVTLSLTDDLDFSCETRLEKARQVMRQEAKAVLEIAESLGQSFSEAVAMLLRCRGCAILSGIGKAGWVAQKLSATLASTGTASHFLHPAEAIHGDLGRVKADDVVVMFSQSGETEEVIRILPSLKETGVKLIAVTATQDSTLARYADVVLSLGRRREADSNNLAPSTSTTAMLALGDALALVASAERGFRAEHFAKYHPGGSLGRKLSLVDEYMRPIEECRVAPDNETVREIFMRHRVPGRRSGAVVMQNEQGTLSGIFTDSDLARLFESRNDSLLDCPIAEVMTKTPQVVSLGSNMLEAVAVMARRKISELPVVDENRVPVGMLDITDVVAHFPEYALYAENGNGDQADVSPSLRVVA